MVGTVWMANCNNYFRHPNGKVVTQFPYSGLTFAQRLAQVAPDMFVVPQESAPQERANTS
jgi:cyclohexanone monooxygenase